jgi:hypothetical protein
VQDCYSEFSLHPPSRPLSPARPDRPRRSDLAGDPTSDPMRIARVRDDDSGESPPPHLEDRECRWRTCANLIENGRVSGHRQIIRTELR